MQILKTMRDAGVEPDVVAYTTAIKVQSFPVHNFLYMLHIQTVFLKGYS